MPATLQRPVRRRRSRRPAAVQPAALPLARVVTSGLLTPPRLVGVPLSITLRNHADQPAESVVVREQRALASVRPYLRPTDQGEGVEDFIQLGVCRALPPMPKFKEFGTHLTYGYDPAAIEIHCDPSDCHGQRDVAMKKYPKAIVFLDTREHTWVDLGYPLPHLHERDQPVAEWLAALITATPFAITPRHWLEFISNMNWHGEADETEVKSEYGDEYEGPTLAGFKAHVPEWVRKPDYRLLEDWIVNLRMIARARILGLETAGFFNEMSGELLTPTGLRATRIYNGYDPVAFGWRSRDMVEQAIDEDKDQQMQVGETCDAFAAIAAVNLPVARLHVERAIVHLRALDRLCTDLNRYRKQHKLA